MPPNLRKTPHGYTYLRTVPPGLRKVIPKSVIKEALGRDRKKALARWAELEIETSELFENVRAKLADGRSVEDALAAFLRKDPSTRLKKLPANRQGLAEQFSALYLAGLSEDYAAREDQRRWVDGEEPLALTREVEVVLSLIKNAVMTGDASAFVPVVEQLAALRGYRLVDESGEDIHRVTYRFLRAVQAGYEVLAKRQRGEFADTPVSTTPPLPPAWELDVRPVHKAAVTLPMLSDVTDLYKDRLSTKNAKTQTTSLSWWLRFTEYCQDRPLVKVGTNDVYGFLEQRLHAEIKPWSMSYCSLVRRGLGEAFALAKTKGLCSNNPALELDVLPKIKVAEEKRRKKPRYPYSVAQLNILFKSDWYDPMATNWHGKMKLDLGARYWIPLLCLFHGLRIREPLQLSVADIAVGEVPLLKIQTEEAGEISDDGLPEKRVKNDATKRTVPIHPMLVELGFLSFVEHARARGANSPLFPSSVPEKDSEKPMWGRAYEQRFVPFVRDALGFGAGYGNHSFRHTLEDCLRDTQMRSGVWPAGLVPFYTGRLLPRLVDRDILPPVGSERRYGNRGNPNLMLPWVERLHYPDLQLPTHFDSWLNGRPAVDTRLIADLDRAWGREWRGKGAI